MVENKLNLSSMASYIAVFDRYYNTAAAPHHWTILTPLDGKRYADYIGWCRISDVYDFLGDRIVVIERDEEY